MSAALVILLALLSLCPAIVTVDGPFIPCLIPLLLSGGLIVSAVRLPPGEAQHLSAVLTRPFLILAALPALLMIFQMLPLPFFANPVWASVSSGFSRAVTGSVTADTGATALTLAWYLSIVGTVLLAAAAACNRERSESILAGTAAAAMLISLAVLVNELSGAGVLAARDEAFDCACLGVTLSAACGMLVFERYETRRFKPGQSPRKFLLASVACLTAFVICSGAVAAARSGSLAFAAASGLVTFCAVAVIRRFALGRLGAVAIGFTAIVIAVALMSVSGGDSDPRFAFVKKDSAAIELTRRMLNDAPLLGNGAGTFGALLPIYRPAGSEPADMAAVTAAAKLSIEMGRVSLWLSILSGAGAVYALLRGAARRGRDSFYAAAAGSSLVTVMNLAFVNTGLAGAALPLLAATVFGLGLAQARSRSMTLPGASGYAN